MSADLSANLQVYTPPGSGRSSPAPRAYRNATEECTSRVTCRRAWSRARADTGAAALHKKDKGFRRYAAGLERTLALWDTAQQEWADYISFLGRLLKVNHSSLPPSCNHHAHTALCPGPAIPPARTAHHPT